MSTTEVHIPPPLSFLVEDSIDPDNQKIIEREQNRWRLLTLPQRVRLKWYVASLARELQKHNYNQHAKKLAQLRLAVGEQKALYAQAKADGDKVAGYKARRRILALIEQARPVAKRLHELAELKARYDHYAGWIDYEAKNRHELAEDKKRDERDRRDMRKESKHLEQIMVSVFKNTQGCHYMKKDSETGKEKAIAPKFDRDSMRPDAHYFLLAARRRFLFGYKWRLPYGVTVDRLTSEDVLNNLRAATGRQVDVVWSETGQLMFRVSRLDSPDALPKLVKWSDAMRYFPDKIAFKLPYTIGVTDGRKFQWFDFASDPHMLVAGKSQSGKSNLVNGVIATLASTHTPDELRIVLVDMKGGIEFTHWHELPHVLGDVVKTVEEVKPSLERLRSIMNSRLATLERAKAKNIAAYNKKVDRQYQMARVLIVIDEMNTFVGMGKLTDEIHNLIMMLVSQGRAVGVHVICATQHPEVAVIPSRIKTNMSMRISGAMPNVGASMIVLDSSDAANIPNVAGRLVAVIGLRTLVVQSPYITDEEIAGVVSAAQVAYPMVSETLSDQQEQPQVIVWNEQRVIVSALDLLQGQLSMKKMHKLFGDESPGERELSRIIKRIVDEVESVGYVTRDDDGSTWTIKRAKNNVKMLIPHDTGLDSFDGFDAENTPVRAVIASKPLSQPDITETVEAPAMSESAAD